MTEFALGVLIEVDDAAGGFEGGPGQGGDVPASGHRGQHRGNGARRMVLASEDALRAVAYAVGREVATVVTGVVRGIDGDPLLGSAGAADRPFDVGDIELKFGVKAAAGVGKPIALMTASGEATVEVTVKLRRRAAS